MRQRPPRLRVGPAPTPRVVTHQAEDRGTTHERGYGRQWQLLRQVVLNEEPVCRRCMARGRVTAATLVDHMFHLAESTTQFFAYLRNATD